HVCFNREGFHNHIPHHLLALYGTGASAKVLQKGFGENTSYQWPAKPLHEHLATAEDLHQHRGNANYYPDFLRFYQREIEAKGWQAVMSKQLFSGDDASEDLLLRIFSGFFHPMIQLMCALEFQQPAIVAEALAQAAVHGKDDNGFLLESERLANANPSAAEKMGPIIDLVKAVRADEALATAATAGQVDQVSQGVLRYAKDELIKIGARVKAKPEELDERTAEMYDACMYMAVSAAMHPIKHPEFDFWLV
ncbi:hypothetical protein B0T17DRAFT_483728, partial [Bombardia bombarda]